MQLIPYSRHMYNVQNNKVDILSFLISQLSKPKRFKVCAQTQDIENFILRIKENKEYNALLYYQEYTHYNKRIKSFSFNNVRILL